MSLSDLFQLLVKRKVTFLLVLLVSWAALSAFFLMNPPRDQYQTVLKVLGYKDKRLAVAPLNLIYSSGQMAKQFYGLSKQLAKTYQAQGDNVKYAIARTISASTAVWSQPNPVLVFLTGKKGQEQQVKAVMHQLMTLYKQSSYNAAKTKTGIMRSRFELAFKAHHYQFPSAAAAKIAEEKFVNLKLSRMRYVPLEVSIPLIHSPSSPRSDVGFLLLALLFAGALSTIIVTLDKCFISIKDGLFYGTH